MNDTVKGITPESDREHVISLYGHLKGVERNRSYKNKPSCPFGQ